MRFFVCPICGKEAAYYGADLAICSTGAKLSLRDVPSEIVYSVNSRIISKNVNAHIQNIAPSPSMGSIYPLDLNDPYGRNSRLFNSINQALEKQVRK
jgi:hypothetical protein